MNIAIGCAALVLAFIAASVTIWAWNIGLAGLAAFNLVLALVNVGLAYVNLKILREPQ